MASFRMLLVRRILVASAVWLFAHPVLAQTGSNVVPQVINGRDSNNGMKLSPVGDGTGGSVPMPVTGTLTPAPSPSPSSGIAPSAAGSSSSSQVLKASGGNLYSAYATAGATAGWLMIFNSATAPSNGATTAGTAAGGLQDCVQVPANQSISINYAGGPPEVFSTGITLVFSSTGCATLTASATAYLHGSAS
jgi:hypothetical protein